MAAIVDDRIVAFMRLALAASALLIILIDPSEPDRLVAVTYAALSLYTLYSAARYLLTLWTSPQHSHVYRLAHWIDVGWYVVLIALSRGTSSIFFFGFFFAILVASFRWGFAEGMSVTGLSAALFTIVGFATAPGGAEFELNRFLLRPIYMLVLGYMMAYWGGLEIRHKRRLALLRSVAAFANPRFGIERTTTQVMDWLRAHYDAATCLLITHNAATGEYRLRRIAQGEIANSVRPEALPHALAERLLPFPADQAVVYDGPPRLFDRLLPTSGYLARDIVTGARPALNRQISATLATTIDAVAFISVPLRYHGETIGRGYLTSRHRRAFDVTDIEFILQVVDQVAPVIDNIRLVDRLASDAAEAERQRIARDLHDSVIQPYIGLQMGLAAIREKLANGHAAAADIERLHQLTAEGIRELRGYVRGLQAGGDAGGGIAAALRRFASKFTAAAGIDVRVAVPDGAWLNDRLAAEVFQIVVEGLSNIRRHTHSSWANVQLAREADRVVVRIENERQANAPAEMFTPRSIAERSAALGGHTRVEHVSEGSTAVVIEIPL